MPKHHLNERHNRIGWRKQKSVASNLTQLSPKSKLHFTWGKCMGTALRHVGLLILLALGSIFFSTALFAADTEKKIPDRQHKAHDWVSNLKLGAALGWNYTRDVVGALSGDAFNLGGEFDVGVTYSKNKHEWDNQLSLIEGFTKTPIFDNFFKSSDMLRYRQTYVYNFLDWLGVYGEFKLQTSIFAGEDIRPKPTTYQITDASGATTDQTSDRLALTTPFKPLLLTEEVGLRARALQETYANLNFKVAAAANEIFADGQRVVTDATDALVKIKTLVDVQQVGPAIGAYFKGATWGDRIHYHASAEAMLPLWENIALDSSKTVWDNMDTDFEAGAAFQFLPWLGLEWKFIAQRIPAIVDKYQLQNMLLLTANLAQTF
jgi:hypothetical protein